MYFDNSIIVARWPRAQHVKENWGDKLNPALIHGLTGMPVAHVSDMLGWQDRVVYRVIGSGLSGLAANEASWGMGFIDSNSDMPKHPGSIHAVRGPKSRALLMQAGMACPEIYGDPAILYPMQYWPDIEPIHDIGLIQHFREINAVPPPKIPKDIDYITIDVNSDINEFIDQILSCKAILSSSLHGIICANAYGIPAFWLDSSDLPLGDGFKFHDYYASIGVENMVPATIDSDGNCVFPKKVIVPYPSRIDADELINACPFMPSVKKKEWQRKRRKMKDDGREGTIFNTPRRIVSALW